VCLLYQTDDQFSSPRFPANTIYIITLANVPCHRLVCFQDEQLLDLLHTTGRTY
jgi:hypothetical protein